MKGLRLNHRGRSVELILIAALAALLLIPAGSHAQLVWSTSPDTLCTNATPGSATDTDGDGYTDYEECFGVAFASAQPPNIFGYKQDAGAGTAPDRLDPSKPDLLYLVTNEKGDLDLTDPNSLLVKAMAAFPNGALNVYANGLNIRAHRIYLANINKGATGTDRLVISGNTTTRAARIAEILTPANAAIKDTALGLTPEGKPSVANVYSKIYTKRIYDNVYANCASDTACSIKNTLPLIKMRDAIVSYYILQVVAHEMGHGSMLAPANTDGYYHYSKSGTLMDPSVIFSRGVYTIPTSFDSGRDPLAVTLK